MKRLVFCFDGTWNKLSAECPTNVVLLAESVIPTAKDRTPQVVYYDEGVGTSRFDRFIGGAFGVGLETNLREAYRFLIFNHEPGDEIFIFGFSRGAFTARSFAGFLRHSGILAVDSATKIDKALELYVSALKKEGDDHPRALRFRAENSPRVWVSEMDADWRCANKIPGFDKTVGACLNIRYVGVWDTVGALGWPNILPFAGWLNRRKGFHDVRLTSKVWSARQALALDERRKLFRPTIWNNVNEVNDDRGFSIYDIDAPFQQRWFPGVHGSVGGGGPIRGLSDYAFSWVVAGARRAGLQLNVSETSRLYTLRPDALAPLQNDPDRPWHERGSIGKLKRFVLNADREGPLDLRDVSAPARRRWMTVADDLPERLPYRPRSLNELTTSLTEFAAAYPLPQASDIEVKSASHVVAAGDSLAKIAQKYLGSADQATKIFEANQDVIDDPREIQRGWTLRLPQF